MYSIKDERILFQDLFTVAEAQITQHGNTFRRVAIKKQNAAAVLVYNKDEDSVILTRQLRYPIVAEHPGLLDEIPAGKIDAGETAIETAFREVEEEVGYKVLPENMELVMECYPTPGYSSELFSIYFASVSNNDRVDNGGGIDSENEFIQVISIKRAEFCEQIKRAEYRDGKTYLAALMLMLKGKL